MTRLVMHSPVLARLAAAVALVAAPIACRSSLSDHPEGATARAPLAALVHALPFRPIEGRLAVNGPHRAYRADVQSRVSDWPVAALDIARGMSRTPEETMASTHTHAVLELMMGRVETARPRLVSVAEQAPTTAAYWIDVSAAHLAAAAKDEGHARLVVLALDAAARASALDPTRPEAWFNQGLALERLGIATAAADAWRRARETESDAGWRTEIETRSKRSAARSAGDWPARRARLLNPGESVDAGLMTRLTRDETHLVRQFVEDDLLPAWGQATREGRANDAHTLLDRSRALTDAIGHHHVDVLLKDAIAAIDKVNSGGEAVRRLAAAHEMYGRGVRLYEDTRREASLAEFRRANALFSEAGSPFGLKARLQIGIVAYQLNRAREAHAIFAQVCDRADLATHPSLRARAEWLKALAATKLGLTERAIDAYRLATTTFERIGDGENLAAVASAAADTLRLIGEQTEGWAFLSRALEGLRDVHTTRRRHTILLNLSLYAEDEGLQWSALVFQDASLAAARERGTANTIAEALTHRAQLHVRAGDEEKAARDLAEATDLLPKIPSVSAREYVAAWLDLAKGELEHARAPALAARLFERVGGFFDIAEPDEIPRLRLRRGNALLRAGLESEAEREWLLGISILESRWRRFADEQYRVSYLDEGWNLFDALIELEAIRRQDHWQALELAERGRARTRTRQSSPVVTTLQRMTPANTLVLYYVLLDDRTLIWAIDSDGIRFAAQPVSKAALQQKIRAYLAILDAGRTRAEIDQASEALHDVLVGRMLRDRPTPRTIAVIADSFLHALPFATLRNPRTKRYLVEESAVTMAPSATHLMEASLRLSEPNDDSPARALLIGGGAEGSRSKNLAALPEVKAELGDIATLYARATTLTDSGATLSAFESALPGHTVLHFAGHAIANDRFPWRSHLMLAPDSTNPSGALSIKSLNRLRVPRLRLAVLSACQTAAGPALRGEGVVSLARPFLEARVPAVIGTLWDIEDLASRRLLVRFHEAYLHNADAVHALQSAQLALLRSTDERLSHPRSWGSHIAISGLELGPTPITRRLRSARTGTPSSD